jgi:hypothetical protein
VNEIIAGKSRRGTRRAVLVLQLEDEVTQLAGLTFPARCLRANIRGCCPRSRQRSLRGCYAPVWQGPLLEGPLPEPGLPGPSPVAGVGVGFGVGVGAVAVHELPGLVEHVPPTGASHVRGPVVLLGRLSDPLLLVELQDPCGPAVHELPPPVLHELPCPALHEPPPPAWATTGAATSARPSRTAARKALRTFGPCVLLIRRRGVSHRRHRCHKCRAGAHDQAFRGGAWNRNMRTVLVTDCLARLQLAIYRELHRQRKGRLRCQPSKS